MPKNFAVRVSWIAGASCYWTYILLLIGVSSEESHAGIPAFLSLVFLGANALTATIVALCSHFYGYLPSKKLLGVLLGAIGVFDFFILFIFRGVIDADFAFFFLTSFLRGVRVGILMQFWGLRFAKASVDEVSFPVSLTAFLSTALFLIFLEAGSTLLNICTFVLPLVSSAALVFVHRSVQDDTPPLFADPVLPGTGMGTGTGKRKRFRFFASRAFYGIGIGLLFGLVLSGENPAGPLPGDSSPGFFVGAIVLVLSLACAALIQKKRIVFRDHWLIAFPVVISGLTTVVAVINGVSVYSYVVTASAWLYWIFLSSTQIPLMCKILRIGETSLALLEKVVVVLPWFITRLLLVAFDNLVVADPTGEVYAFENTLSIVFSYLILLAAVISLTRFTLFSAKAIQSKARSVEFQGSPEDVHHAIATRFRLTPREREVFSLLAGGRNRAYIQKQLYISEGTAKTHINHIHQKLGVSTQQELLDLVNAPRN